MPTGKDLVKLALQHVGEDYVLGAVAALNDADYQGPWDCSLFGSWLVYQVSGIVYGAIGSNPATADPYTGAWWDDANSRGQAIDIDTAAMIPGAAVLRVGQRIGHLVISDGKGGTVEAAGAAYGVIRSTLANRRWTCGVLVPGIDYEQGSPVPVAPPGIIYRVTDPPMRGDGVTEIQRALLRAGFNPKDLDGIYGSQTVNAVIKFQRAKGLVVDGEVGPQTLHALGVR